MDPVAAWEVVREEQEEAVGLAGVEEAEAGEAEADKAVRMPTTIAEGLTMAATPALVTGGVNSSV